LFAFNHPIYFSVLILHHLALHFFTNRSRPLEIFKIGFEYFVGFVNNIWSSNKIKASPFFN